MATAIEAAIWNRVFDTSTADLSPEAAQFLLRLDFRESDHARMSELAERAQSGILTEMERLEYEDYLRVGNLLGLMQSLARSVQHSKASNGHESRSSIARSQPGWRHL